MPVPPQVAAGGVDVGKGGALYAARGCVACHGPKGEGMALFPTLAGKSATEVETALRAYRAGETIGVLSPVMMPNSAVLSDTDIADIAAYIDTL